MFYFLARRTYMTRPRPARKAKWSPHLRTLRRAKRLTPRLSSSCFLPSVPPSISLDNLGLMDTPTFLTPPFRFLLFSTRSSKPTGAGRHPEHSRHRGRWVLPLATGPLRASFRFAKRTAEPQLRSSSATTRGLGSSATVRPDLRP